MKKLKTYVIHFWKLKERKKRLETELKKHIQLNVEWLVQRRIYSEDIIKRYYKYDISLWIKKARIAKRPIIPRKLSQSEIELAINHIKIWRKISVKKNKFALVLEDDVIFEKNFDERLKSILNKINKWSISWDIIYLDYLSRDYPKTKRTEILERRNEYDCWGAAAYIIKREAAKKILRLGKFTLPIDEELKYRINELKLKPIWIIPPLVKQGSTYIISKKSGQSKREKQGIKKYFFWRKKIYSLLSEVKRQKIYNLENSLKKKLLGIK